MTNIYRTALQVQDASNPSGVVNTLAKEIMPGIRNEAGYREQGTKYIATHPAYILFLDKLVSLTGVAWVNDMGGAISQAYEDCRILAEGLEAVEAARLPGGPLSEEVRS
jgi:hypothetical protein